MARKVADVMWEMLANAGVKRCYGIVGDALNPVIDALRRNGKIEFIHVRHEEYGVFAAVADAYLSGSPVVVCGTAGPGVTHLFNGLMDARKEGAPIIAIAGDVETSLMDTAALEELNPYKFFDTACLYVGRIVNPTGAGGDHDRDSDCRCRQGADSDLPARRHRIGERAGPFFSRGHDSRSARVPPGRRGFGQAGRNDRSGEEGGDLRRRRLPRCTR